MHLEGRLHVTSRISLLRFRCIDMESWISNRGYLAPRVFRSVDTALPEYRIVNIESWASSRGHLVVGIALIGHCSVDIGSQISDSEYRLVDIESQVFRAMDIALLGYRNVDGAASSSWGLKRFAHPWPAWRWTFRKGGRADDQQQRPAGTRANACLATSLFGTGHCHRHCHHSRGLQLLPRGWSPMPVPGLAESWGPRAGRGWLRN